MTETLHPPRIALSATNPCHLYDFALGLHARGALAAWYSGYPGWRLRPPAGFPIRAHSARTLLTYSANRLPPRLRPDMLRLFRWQDAGFDRWVAARLEPCAAIHALPGQALHTFRRARALGIRTVLNHASGPLWQQNARVAAEYARAGLPAPARHPLMAALEARHRAEYTLADYHCVASTIVRDQLVAEGINPQRIGVVPYGADPEIFHKRGHSAKRGRSAPANKTARSAVFAGQLVLRKGLKTLLDALEILPEYLAAPNVATGFIPGETTGGPRHNMPTTALDAKVEAAIDPRPSTFDPRLTPIDSRLSTFDQSPFDQSTLANRQSPIDISLACYGPLARETEADFAAYRGVLPVVRHGVVARQALADAFRAAAVCVLPSWEEAFGLVVPQALACGCPCIVSDRVGAKDLIRPRENGSVFPVGDAGALATEIAWWLTHPQRVEGNYDWNAPVERLLEWTSGLV
jgi:glycosyltransferase involved in cell wall biosynthesis